MPLAGHKGQCDVYRDRLSRVLRYSWQIMSICNVTKYFGNDGYAPLTTCFLPDPQHHRLSVKTSLPLSPLHRFALSNYAYHSPAVVTCHEGDGNFAFLKLLLVTNCRLLWYNNAILGEGAAILSGFPGGRKHRGGTENNASRIRANNKYETRP